MFEISHNKHIGVLLHSSSRSDHQVSMILGRTSRQWLAANFRGKWEIRAEVALVLLREPGEHVIRRHW